uniref:Breast carcinoma amplified sequence 1 n=1 Tax=Pavo cristatus TaxID=9049 RepID=A0A8C9L669_PAVCR
AEERRVIILFLMSEKRQKQKDTTSGSDVIYSLDVKESVARDNAAASSPKTKERSAAAAGGEAAGSAASKALPSAKLRSVFAFSWSVPGRTEDPASDSSVGLAKLDVSSEAHSANKAPSDSAASPAAAAPQPSTHKEPDQATPTADPQLSSPTVPGIPEGEDAAVLKPKQVNFFDKIFKLEKGKERSQAQTGAQEGGRPSGAPDGQSTAQEVARQQNASNSIPAEKASAGRGLSMPHLMTTRNNSSTGQPVAVMVTEQQPVTSVKSDKNVPSAQEPQTAKQNTKAPEEAAKEKGSSTPMPLSKLFWKKVCLDFKAGPSPSVWIATAESEPVGQKSKESSKDKKPPAELSKQKGSKQETREQPDCREQHAAETDSIQSGGDTAKEPTSFKRMEKRQSLGGFFKGLVPKMQCVGQRQENVGPQGSDLQVQCTVGQP